jgi:hypothetical protein
VAVGEIGHEERDRIGEGAPGEEVGEIDAADLGLHRIENEEVRGRDDGHHGGDRHEEASEHGHAPQ